MPSSTSSPPTTSWCRRVCLTVIILFVLPVALAVLFVDKKAAFAFIFSSISGRAHAHTAKYKADLFTPANIHGSVLEIGPGLGVNLQYYANLTISSLHLGEPNPHFHEALHAEVSRLHLQQLATVDSTPVQDMPASFDGTFDAVVSTTVLCSVPDVAEAAQAIHRLLKPGGKFVFLEHVRAPTSDWFTYAIQTVLEYTFLWRHFGDGCRLMRDIGSTLSAQPGWEVAPQLVREGPPGPARFFSIGVATKHQ